MRPGGKQHSGWSGRAPAAALLAVFALLIQALLPAAAMAAQSRSSGETIVICTQMGVQTIKVGEDGKTQKGFAGLPCQDCLGAATAALPAPEPIALPVAYVVAQVEHTTPIRARPQIARAPPRPPGQGPPTA
ncbi:DUF2946 domain-containing protein [Phenylobacterium hankyongense]|uniref:DUF2946 domain-containing protein n=1 Tax=Phenylobacterium hankyongense TaxID=1813876 RepID=A0A328B496_9CAUL|nr:DUF2946 family protein [Phenylobacterium hankyongense]RAK59838.1 DUF2946 domain-containing protein [Phenylobacterium hankyongense]